MGVVVTLPQRKQGYEDVTAGECPLVPSVVKYAFKHAPAVQSEEQLLWRLVAARAVLDCVGVTGFGPSQHKKHMAAVIDAQKWFRSQWDYVRQVFDRAGVEVDGVREAMRLFHLGDDDKVVMIEVEKKRGSEIHQTERSRAGAC